MTEKRSGDAAKESHVADSWENAEDEMCAQLEERQRQILKKKQKEEELAKAREVAAASEQLLMMESCSRDEKPQSFKILRRPQSCGTLPTSSRSGASAQTTDQQPSTRLKSLEEREAAYLQARERIFGGDYNPEEEPDPTAGVEGSTPAGGSGRVPGAATGGSPNAAIPPVARAYSAPIPRPRAPAPFRGASAMRPQHFQPMTVASPGVGFTTYYAPLSGQPVPMHALPLVGAPLPYYDARVPPPHQGGLYSMQPVIFATSGDPNDPAYNPIPYGRPPAQLLSQSEFSAAYNASTNPNY